MKNMDNFKLSPFLEIPTLGMFWGMGHPSKPHTAIVSIRKKKSKEIKMLKSLLSGRGEEHGEDGGRVPSRGAACASLTRSEGRRPIRAAPGDGMESATQRDGSCPFPSLPPSPNPRVLCMLSARISHIPDPPPGEAGGERPSDAR